MSITVIMQFFLSLPQPISRSLFFIGLLFTALLIPNSAYPYSGNFGTNITNTHNGPVGQGGDATCGPGCHSGNTYSAFATVSFTSGCSSIAHDSTESCSIGLTNSLASKNGINMSIYNALNAERTGMLSISNSTLVSVDFNRELSHSTPQNANFKWPFQINAPSTLGTYRLYFCINQVDGDTFGFDAGDGFPVCSNRTVTVTNSAPNAINDHYINFPALSVTESSSFSNFDMCGNDTDSEGDTISYVSNTALSGSGTLTRSSACNFSFNTNGLFESLAAGESAFRTFNYTIRDSYGLAYQNSATVTLRITGQNDAPVLGAQTEEVLVSEGSSATTLEIGGVLQSNVLQNDSDIDASDTLVVIYNPPTDTAPSNGSLSLNANGSFTYAHDGSETLSDSFTYRISDGTLTSAAKTVIVTVSPSNDPPVAADDNVQINESSTIDINVVGNDFDSEGSQLTAAFIETTRAAQYGSITDLGNGVIRYRHNGSDIAAPGDSYRDRFTYRADDSVAQSGDSTVTITITEINDNPLAANDAFIIEANSTNNAFNVLNNDTDPDNTANDAFDTMEIVSTSRPTAGGSVSIVGSGDKNALTYSPAANSQTPESFTYTMQDAAGVQSTASVQITFIDTDSDTITDALDNCPILANPSQLDTDNDALGDVCDNDPNATGILQTFIVFDVDQNGKSGNVIFQDAGNITVTADLNANTGAGDITHDFLSQTQAELLAAPVNIEDALSNTFEFNPANLTIGTYTIDVTINNAGSTTHNTLLINVLASTEPTLNANDTDGDGSNDNDPTEGFADDDNDGIPNYRDNANESPNQLSLNTASSFARLIQSPPNTKLSIGDIASASGIFGASITPVALENFANNGAAAQNINDDSYAKISEILDFIISDIPQIGGSVDVVIPLTSSIRANAIYRKYTAANGWQNFVSDDNNQIASAKATAGICPPPGSADYISGLTLFDNCLQLTLQDGGPNDSDAEINGIIRDPGVIVISANQPAQENDPCAQNNQNEVSTCADNSGSIGTLNPAWLWFLSLPVLTRKKYTLKF